MSDNKFGQGIPLASNFDLGAKIPLDSRITVGTIEERDEHITKNRVYEGMQVYVEETKKTYFYSNGEWIVLASEEYVDKTILQSGGVTEEVLEGYAKKEEIPVRTSDLENDSKFTSEGYVQAITNEVEKKIDNVEATLDEKKADKEHEHEQYLTRDDIGDLDLDNLGKDCYYVGETEPEDDEKIWFDNDSLGSSEITIDNPLVNELLNIVKALQSTVNELKEEVKDLRREVEYLKENGVVIPPDDDEDDDDEDETKISCLELEEGGLFLLEDGGYFLLEESEDDDDDDEEDKSSYLELEDGGLFLAEDGSYILLEESIIEEEEDISSYLELENDGLFLLEDGGRILLESSKVPADKASYLMAENGTNLLMENGDKILLENSIIDDDDEEEEEISKDRLLLLENNGLMLFENNNGIKLENQTF